MAADEPPPVRKVRHRSAPLPEQRPRHFDPLRGEHGSVWPEALRALLARPPQVCVRVGRRRRRALPQPHQRERPSEPDRRAARGQALRSVVATFVAGVVVVQERRAAAEARMGRPKGRLPRSGALVRRAVGRARASAGEVLEG